MASAAPKRAGSAKPRFYVFAVGDANPSGDIAASLDESLQACGMVRLLPPGYPDACCRPAVRLYLWASKRCDRCSRSPDYDGRHCVSMGCLFPACGRFCEVLDSKDIDHSPPDVDNPPG